MPTLDYKDSTHKDLHDPNATIGPVPSILFKHAIGSATYQPLALARLSIDNMALDPSLTSLIRFINFPSLEELRLRRCPQSGAFLKALATVHTQTPLTLKRFELAEYRNDDIGPLNDFLHSFTGLTHLLVVVRWLSDEIPDVSSILNHGSTLTTLLIEADVEEDPDFYYGPEELARVLGGCPHLQQLGLSMAGTAAGDPQIGWRLPGLQLVNTPSVASEGAANGAIGSTLLPSQAKIAHFAPLHSSLVPR